jgi:hypothetical protein
MIELSKEICKEIEAGLNADRMAEALSQIKSTSRDDVRFFLPGFDLLFFFFV